MKLVCFLFSLEALVKQVTRTAHVAATVSRRRSYQRDLIDLQKVSRNNLCLVISSTTDMFLCFFLIGWYLMALFIDVTMLSDV